MKKKGTELVHLHKSCRSLLRCALKAGRLVSFMSRAVSTAAFTGCCGLQKLEENILAGGVSRGQRIAARA